MSKPIFGSLVGWFQVTFTSEVTCYVLWGLLFEKPKVPFSMYNELCCTLESGPIGPKYFQCSQLRSPGYKIFEKKYKSQGRIKVLKSRT